MELIDRLLSKIDTSGECWLWTAQRDPDGYGRINVARRPLLAHRVAYELLVGSIPEGMVVMHTCDRPPCVNPTHLRTGTQADNLADAASKGRMVKPKAAICKYGHSLADPYINGDGKRVCRPCRNRRQTAWRSSRRIAA